MKRWNVGFISSLLNLLVYTHDLCVYNSGKSHSLNTIWYSDYDRCTWKTRRLWMNLNMERQNKHGGILWSWIPSKASCSAPGDNTLFKRQYKAISTGDSDPKWHSKDVHFPVFSGGAKKFLRLSQEKVPAKHMGWAFCMHHFPSP